MTFLLVVPLQFLDGSHEIRPGTSIEVEHWLHDPGSRGRRRGGRSWSVTEGNSISVTHGQKVLHLLSHEGGNCKLDRQSHGSLNSGWGGSEDVRDDMAMRRRAF